MRHVRLQRAAKARDGYVLRTNLTMPLQTLYNAFNVDVKHLMVPTV